VVASQPGIDPIDIVSGNTTIVLRPGGNAITPRGSLTPDYQTISSLLGLVQYLAKAGVKVVVVPGGVGGHVFADWARHVGCSDAFMNSVGCALIDLGAQILADQFSRKLAEADISCPPSAANNVQELLAYHRAYSVVVCQSGIRGAISSDSLALLVAGALRSPVLSIKRNVPFREIISALDPGRENSTHNVALSDIEHFVNSDDLVGSAGWHHSLDVWALRMLRRPGVALSFTSVKALKHFPESFRLDEVLRVIT